MLIWTAWTWERVNTLGAYKKIDHSWLYTIHWDLPNFTDILEGFAGTDVSTNCSEERQNTFCYDYIAIICLYEWEEILRQCVVNVTVSKQISMYYKTNSAKRWR